ncbi:MAG: AAA family ATPase [Bacteroidaceae bacterium]|nr:AAA family ATPase [Bacteroidaceae bacterium]
MHLSSISIKNFRGIKSLEVKFDRKLNVIIGANGCYKSTLIDAIRIFYSWGTANHDINITKEDFHREIKTNDKGIDYEEVANRIEIEYDFEALTAEQEGAYYQYLVSENGRIFAQVNITFTTNDKGWIISSFTSGKPEACQKADPTTFNYFNAYYLSALRDSTRDLMSTKNNLLGKVIKRKIDKNKTASIITDIITKANEQLLRQNEVSTTKTEINKNLEAIYHKVFQEVGLQIEQSRIEYIVNAIKPYIPHKL